jgi:nucleoside 2-deoxyribosyltransferase
MRRQPRVYLAGPDVFFPEPLAWAQRKQAICQRHGLVGVSPLDELANDPEAWAAAPEWQRLAFRNEAHIRGCDAVIANLTPFRGPSADVGTVYEVGFARALGRPVFGYATTSVRFRERTLDHIGASIRQDSNGLFWDPDGLLVEEFGLFDNLMIEGAIAGSGGRLVLEDCPPGHRWGNLTAFECCVKAAGAWFQNAATPTQVGGQQ